MSGPQLACSAFQCSSARTGSEFAGELKVTQPVIFLRVRREIKSPEHPVTLLGYIDPGQNCPEAIIGR
jgi:hypothetical protein